MVGRPIRLEDLDDYQALDNDREVTQWAVGGPTEEQGMKRAIQHWEEHGLGLWTFLSDDGAFVGYAGLTHTLRVLPGEDRFQLRCAVCSEHRRHGYATEMTNAVVDFAFKQKGVDEVIGAAESDNIASRKLMEKCGFRYDRKCEIYRRSSRAD